MKAVINSKLQSYLGRLIKVIWNHGETQCNIYLGGVVRPATAAYNMRKVGAKAFGHALILDSLDQIGGLMGEGLAPKNCDFECVGQAPYEGSKYGMNLLTTDVSKPMTLLYGNGYINLRSNHQADIPCSPFMPN